MNNAEPVIAGFVFLLGAVVGSFLNVCIVRLPRGKSVVTPRSQCTHCGKLIPWYDNIPLLSFWVRRGRCRFCGQKFSIRYFVVELLTALLFFFLYDYQGLSWSLIPYGILGAGLIAATFIDLEHRIIPDEITLGGIVVGLLVSLLIPSLHITQTEMLQMGRWLMWVLVAVCLLEIALGFLLKRETMGKEDAGFLALIAGLVAIERLIDYWASRLFETHFSDLARSLLSLDASLIGFLVGGGLIYAMGVLGDLLFKKESMGGGDVKLLAMAGAFLGWKLTLLTFFIAPVFGAVFGMIQKIRTKDSTIPYGPFLSLGVLISIFFGKKILEWIFGTPFPIFL